MQNIPANNKLETQPPTKAHLRAIVEVVGGQLAIFPIADSDAERAEILDALRFLANEKTEACSW